VINIVIWLLFGALAGWLASIVIRARHRLPLNIAVGAVGALIGGVMFGDATLGSDAFNVGALLISFIGALILLAFANMFGRSTVH
jgi:uncharacterized membrane protein YeaQ/YmgE (transglycosylase-associated protein family)